MGQTGTLLFIPFILLFTGFFVVLFYRVVKSEREVMQNPPPKVDTERLRMTGELTEPAKVEAAENALE